MDENFVLILKFFFFIHKILTVLLFSIAQNLLGGQGVLNDNNWHTVRFSRRASNLRLQVDGAAPVRGMLCMYHQHIFFALISVRDRSLRKRLKEKLQKTAIKVLSDFHRNEQLSKICAHSRDKRKTRLW